MVEEMLIARVHVAVNVLQVRGQQYKYRGHVVQFLRDVGKVYNSLPLIPPNLDIIVTTPRFKTQQGTEGSVVNYNDNDEDATDG